MKKSEKGLDADQIQPVFAGEVPQAVRYAQDKLLQKSVTDDVLLAGGMDKVTFLSWVICGNQLFIWSYLSSVVSKGCVVLEIPSSVLGNRDSGVATKSRHGNQFMVSIVKLDIESQSSDKLLRQCNSVAIVICNRKSQMIAYWPDIYAENRVPPIISVPTHMESDLQGDGRNGANHNDEMSEYEWLNSIIVSVIPGSSHECIAVACQSNGHLWHFHLTPSEIYRKKVSQESPGSSSAGRLRMNKGYPRSLIWRLKHNPPEESNRQFLFLTDHAIECWNVKLAPDINFVKLWTQEIVGNDNDLGIKKDIAGQKHIWLLDMQVDDCGKVFTVLVATLCKDRVSSSSYTQYSLLTMQYKPGQSPTSENWETTSRVLEKKVPLQVVIPKARVEDEDLLFFMRLRVGGKPSGSVIILSGDGTATVANYWRGSTRLYQFDLPWDAGKVLDASVFPASEETEEGAWVVLTEKAGVWAIPEKAVLLGGVEPPERSLSRKGSSNEGAADGEKRSQAFGGTIVPRRASSEAWDVGERQRAALTSFTQRTSQDEEAEALLGHLFQDFLISGKVEGALEKLRKKGAFDKEGETNIFARMSKSIVDTLAKHWTTTRGADFVSSTIVSSLLSEKQLKHKKYLQFLTLSKCHEELSTSQRRSLLIIMEHGEKLSGIIQLRELQHLLSQNRSSNVGSPSSQSQMVGSLWNLIQLVGEKARRNTVLLMDRDNAEVFYSKVSDIEEMFHCLSHHLQFVISGEQPFIIQMQQANEISNACTTLIQTTLRYRNEHHAWYPSPEGLTPWNCQPKVRSGLWSIASFMMQLSREAAAVDMSAKFDLFTQLEGLADVLLEAYTGSITSKAERGEDYKSLTAEYCKRADELLASLYDLAKKFADAKYQDSCNGVENPDLKRTILTEVSSSLALIAKRHEGYQTLWQICYDLNDSALLKSLMRDSVGPKGGFSYFVFKQLIESRHYAELLRLGEEFPEELANFLTEHKDLLWLHEIFLHRFSSASETLHALALSEDDGSNLVIGEEPKSSHVRTLLPLAERRRLLNLSKIAAVAGKHDGYEMKIRRIDADLQILKLQEVIVQMFSNQGEPGDVEKPLHPEELINLCLKGEGKDLVLLAFEVFAWTSSSFRSANRSLLEECWKMAADQDDWAALSQASKTEGWSDEVVSEYLRETILFKASNRCYGPEADSYDGGFEDVLPLQREDEEFQTSRDPLPSVKGILMQHSDFADAGKLMLTAIMVGMEGNNTKAEEDGAMDCI